jgi:hypothetical protein
MLFAVESMALGILTEFAELPIARWYDGLAMIFVSTYSVPLSFVCLFKSWVDGAVVECRHSFRVTCELMRDAGTIIVNTSSITILVVGLTLLPA